MLMLGLTSRMAFDLDSFFFLCFWSAATNALIYWELLCYFSALCHPHMVTKDYWVLKYIRLLPRSRKWAEVGWGLRQQVSGRRGYSPFTYRGLVEFLMVAEDVLETLGSNQQS